MDLQTFLYGIFSSDIVRRRQIIMLWHSPYPVDKKRHQRIADVFEEFILSILYEPCIFKMRSDHFCCLSRGSEALRVPYTMLEKNERNFLKEMFRQRNAHFKVQKQFANGEFNYETGLILHVKQTWKREIVREFAWLVMKRNSPIMTTELITALQRIMLDRGKCDLFLSALHYGIQGVEFVKEVPCWDLDWFDRHEEDEEQRECAARKSGC